MKKYQHILIPIDFSNGSRRAMERAMELKIHYGAQLSLVTVVEPLPAVAYSYIGSADIEDNIIEHAKQELEKWGQEYGITAADQHIISGHPKTEIAHLAQRLECDLIIIGNHSHHGFLSHLLGSTSDAVSHHATCDVLIIRKPKETSPENK